MGINMKMNEQIEALLNEFRNLEEERQKQEGLIDNNVEIKSLQDQLKKLEEKEEQIVSSIDGKMKPYRDKISEIETTQAEIKTTISNNWSSQEKTYKGSLADVTRRTTTSLVIVNKEKLVDFLVKNNQVEDGIKSFNIRLLKGFKKSKILLDEVAELKPNYSISIKFKEDFSKSVDDDEALAKEMEEMLEE